MDTDINTLIELFDRRQDDNVTAAAVFRPKKVVFLCPKSLPDAIRDGIRDFIRSKSPETYVSFRSVDLDDPSAVAKRLEEVLSVSGGGVIDITGGGESAAFAAGMVCAENHIPVIAYDYRNERFVNIRGAYFCDEIKDRFRLSVCDTFRIAGGTVEGFGRISPGEIDDWIPDIEGVWRVFRRHDRVWQKFTAWIQYAVQTARQNGDISKISARREAGAGQGRVRTNITVLRELRAEKLIRKLYWDGENVSFEFKNEKLANLCCDAGVWLELYCWVGCLRSGVFDDCASSVVVKWPVKDKDAKTVTRNELDCCAVRWPVKLFISCKLSTPSAQALNEIKTLTSRFAGVGGRAVLMTMGDASKERFFSQRASDLGIRIIDRNILSSSDPDALPKALAEIAGAEMSGIKSPGTK